MKMRRNLFSQRIVNSLEFSLPESLSDWIIEYTQDCDGQIFGLEGSQEYWGTSRNVESRPSFDQPLLNGRAGMRGTTYPCSYYLNSYVKLKCKNVLHKEDLKIFYLRQRMCLGELQIYITPYFNRNLLLKWFESSCYST